MFAGCTDNYEPECLERSDEIFCPASLCKLDEDYLFPCHDGKFCIHKSLVCDGHAQCEDKSGKSLGR